MGECPVDSNDAQRRIGFKTKSSMCTTPNRPDPPQAIIQDAGSWDECRALVSVYPQARCYIHTCTNNNAKTETNREGGWGSYSEALQLRCAVTLTTNASHLELCFPQKIERLVTF
jgi:hypothetical protein